MPGNITFPGPDTVIPALRADLPLDQRHWLADGVLHPWDGPRDDIDSPVWEEGPEGAAPVRVGSTPRLGRDQALAALEAAVRAYDNGHGAWPTAPLSERIACLQRFAFLMRQQRERVVTLLMWEIAKPRAAAEAEFDRTLDYIADTIDAVKEQDRTGSRFVTDGGILAQIRRAPLGVVLCMGPYNYPLNETFTTLIPAVLMGNTVVFKPAKFGVLLLEPLLAAFRDAFPRGVVNTVYGDGPEVIAPLMESGKVDVLAFIGSSRVADLLKKQHPHPSRMRAVLGLEAKNPAVILPDADLDVAVTECARGALSYNGQRCTAIKLIFVHRDLVDGFLDSLTRAIGEMVPGMPWDAGVDLTPLPEPGKCAYLTDLVTDAVAQGARVVNPDGGRITHSYFHPAILYPVAPTMRVWLEEQFGPVVPVVPYDDIAEPVRFITESPYGQQAALFGTDPDALARLIDPLVNQVCRLNINSQCQRGPDTLPFTGRKASAEGTLSVSDALRVFSIRTLVAARNDDANRRILETIIQTRRSSFLNTDFIF